MKSNQVVQKFCNVAYIVSKVFMILMFICAGMMLLSAVMILAFSTLDIVSEALKISLEKFELDFSAFQFGIMSIAEGIVLLAEGLVFMYARNYFKRELDDGTPFTHSGADELRKLGIRIMAFPLGAIVVSSIVCAVFGVEFADMETSINIGLGVALIFLSFVLHNGAELKEKADRADKSDKDDSFEIHNLFD